jgi:hypothetical protein
MSSLRRATSETTRVSRLRNPSRDLAKGVNAFDADIALFINARFLKVRNNVYRFGTIC